MGWACWVGWAGWAGWASWAGLAGLVGLAGLAGLVDPCTTATVQCIRCFSFPFSFLSTVISAVAAPGPLQRHIGSGITRPPRRAAGWCHCNAPPGGFRYPLLRTYGNPYIRYCVQGVSTTHHHPPPTIHHPPPTINHQPPANATKLLTTKTPTCCWCCWWCCCWCARRAKGKPALPATNEPTTRIKSSYNFTLFCYRYFRISRPPLLPIGSLCEVLSVIRCPNSRGWGLLFWVLCGDPHRIGFPSLHTSLYIMFSVTHNLKLYIRFSLLHTNLCRISSVANASA